MRSSICQHGQSRLRSAHARPSEAHSSRTALRKLRVCRERRLSCVPLRLPGQDVHAARASTSEEAVLTSDRPEMFFEGDAAPSESLALRVLADPALEGDPLAQLKTTEAFWKALKEQPARRGPTIVSRRHRRLPRPADFDVCVCGGTLGILLATTLQMRGHRVCVVERNKLEGRTQEWNVNKHEIQELIRQGCVMPDELQRAIATEFNPVRVNFHEGPEIWVEDVLNMGISPRKLLAAIKRRFQEAGGVLMEQTTFKSAEVFNDGVALKVTGVRTKLSQEQNGSNGAGSLGAAGDVSARLVLDCMGHWSPIVKQIRGTRKPDAICLVVGGCLTGIPAEENRSGDFLRTIAHAEDDMQLFWEAFPAEGGTARTFYMFCYCDTDRRRPTMQAMLEKFFEQLPEYTGRPLRSLKFKRVLFAGLPSYHDGPLKPAFDRIIQVGDAGASASPLSFGGFGSMLRHLGRLTEGLNAALQSDSTSAQALRLLQPYQPSLSSAWLFQRSMSYRVGQLRARRGRSRQQTGFLPPDHVNRLLSCNFRVMRFLGDRVLRPFMQDTIRWLPLTLAMNGMALSDPIAISRVFAQVGPSVLLNWFKHYWAMAGYTLLYGIARPLRRFLKGFAPARILDGWKFGSGLDSAYEPPSHQTPSAAAA